MPSRTFFNLPEEKRERLIQCAREEFARVPYDQVSINKIIQAAEIPRGSFYMYFTNKEDLFLYMMKEFMKSPLQLFQRLLVQSGGDPFRAFIALYDYVEEYSPPDGVGKAFQVFRHNPGLLRGFPGEPVRSSNWMEGVAGHVDWSRFSIRQEQDKEDILNILFMVTAPALGRVAFCGGSPEVRQRLQAQLDILKRGMQAPPFHPSINKLWQQKGDLNHGNDQNEPRD